MKKTTVEKLNKVLDVTGDLIPIGNKKKIPDIEMTETDLTSDYDFSRDQSVSYTHLTLPTNREV